MRSRARSAHVDGTLSQMNEERAVIKHSNEDKRKAPPFSSSPSLLPYPPSNAHTHTRARAHEWDTDSLRPSSLSHSAPVSAHENIQEPRARRSCCSPSSTCHLLHHPHPLPAHRTTSGRTGESRWRRGGLRVARVRARACVGCCCCFLTPPLSLWRNSQEIVSGRPTGVCSPPLLFVSAAFQGDGLQIVRLRLSPAGWELPSRRDAKACLEAVRASAGECLSGAKSARSSIRSGSVSVFVFLSGRF